MVQEHRVINEFDILNKIGEGGYGIVSRAHYKRTHEVVAIKEGTDMKTSLQEINILASLYHPSIVHLKKLIIKKNVFANIDDMKAFIVMEYVEHNLYDFMHAMKRPFSQNEDKCLMFQLIDGVKYTHNNWILHRDLKPSNILINNHGELKICDFGMACRNE